MQFSTLLYAAAALAVANAVEFTMTASQFVSVSAGTPFHFTWVNATGAVTLLLKNGAAGDLKTVTTIQSGLTGTSYSWTPTDAIPSGAYAFEISDSDDSNYSQFFTLAAGLSSVSSSASSTSASSTSASSSSASTTSGTSSSSTVSSTSSTTSSSTTGSSSSSSSSSASSTSSKSSSSKSTGSSTASSTSSTSTTAPTNTSSGSGLASPLAFVLLAVAAIMTLN